MPRTTVLGLPKPDTPVDIDAPRPSRTKSSSKKHQTDKIVDADDPTESVPLELSVSAVPAPVPKPPKPKKPTKQAPSDPTTAAQASPDASEPIVISKPPRKRKKATASEDINNIETSSLVPAAEDAQPGSIAIGASMLPPSPVKKKPRKNKGKMKAATDSTAPPGLFLDPEPTMMVDPVASSVDMLVDDPPESTANAGAPAEGVRGAGRTKTASAIALKAIAQAKEKEAAKVAKEKRKRERAKKTAIDESPAKTAAFVASSSAVDSNIETAMPQVLVSTNALQRVHKSEANKLIAQRLTQRLLASAPPSSSASASGSEVSSLRPSASVSVVGQIRHSRTPSVAPSSRAGSVAPSAISGLATSSRAVSSQPPARPPSPGPAGDAQTLAQHMEGVDEEFIRRLPNYVPLPPPLRSPQRTVPVPDKDITQLTPAQAREYKNACKLGVKDLTPNDRIIVTSVIGRLEALLLTINCFLDPAEMRHLILVANAWGCQKHGLGNLAVEPGSPYELLLMDRMPCMRSEIAKYAAEKVPEGYGIRTIDLTDEVKQYNKEIVEYWLLNDYFVCPPDDPGALYERPILIEMLKHVFFQQQNSVGVVHRDLFTTISIGTIAAMATGLEKSIREYETGVRTKQHFSGNLHRRKLIGHIGTLCDIMKSPQSERLVKHLRGLGHKLLEPFPASSETMNTVVAARIPSVASRYGQKITAPPRPVFPGTLPIGQSSSSASIVKDPEPKPPRAKPKPKAHHLSTKTPVPVSAPVSAPVFASVSARIPPSVPAPILAPAPSASVAEDASCESDTDSALSHDNGADDVRDPEAWANSIRPAESSKARYNVMLKAIGDELLDDNVVSAGQTGQVRDDDSEDGSQNGSETDGEGASGAVGQAEERGAEPETSDDGGSTLSSVE